jgi:hypothetical protein
VDEVWQSCLGILRLRNKTDKDIKNKAASLRLLFLGLSQLSTSSSPNHAGKK